MKIYTGFFILNIALGCKMQDLMHLLEENKEGPLSLKNGLLSVNTDSSLFSSNFSELLSQSDDTLSFNIPITMAMLISAMKETIFTKEFDKDNFWEGYKEFINKSVKAFPKKITINVKQLNRYLAQYIQKNASDVLTGKLATVSYSQNDTAKLAYTSSRSNASEHSSLIQNYWDELGLSEVANNLLEINTTYSTNISTIASESFSGSSQAVETSEANVFFKVLRQNIYDHHSDKDLHFNLVSIYTRLSMSLLAGTRPFSESANFTSYDEATGIWGISEKAQDIPSGARLVPICNTMKSILNTYQILLEEKGLKNNFYLILDGETVIFSAYKAHKFLQNTPDLQDSEILQEYVKNVPLNTDRHLFVRKAIDELVNVHHISTYLGHFSASEEQFGIYSTLDVKDYSNSVINITTKIAHECGIKEL